MVRAIMLLVSMVVLSGAESVALAETPVTYHCGFESLDFIAGDWVEKTGLKTVDDRKWSLTEGRFGTGLHLGASPLSYDIDNMSGLDLDLVTAVIFNVGYMDMKGVGYDEPFLWGAGRLHPGSGAVAFWVRGSSTPENPDARTVLFEQTTTAWGRKERELILIELKRDRTIHAYIEDARYVRHTLDSGHVWRENDWNHIVFMWDRGQGLSLWVNGMEVATTMGDDAWWENQSPGLFHLPMALGTYDEFACFSRPLTPDEIAALHNDNRLPTAPEATMASDDVTRSRQRDAFISPDTTLPVIRPGGQLTVTKITPERVHDDGVQGWWVDDGRYELAWPHEYSVFTIIPGDVDFHAENVDILPPTGSRIDYLTFEGNLDGFDVHTGTRDGRFGGVPLATVSKTDAFFCGIMVPDTGDTELRIPLTRTYGTPPGFESHGDVLRLPLSGDLRLHEVGLFSLDHGPVWPKPGDTRHRLLPGVPDLDGTRYGTALNALFNARDRGVISCAITGPPENPGTTELPPFVRLHLMTEPAVVKSAVATITADLWLTVPDDGTIVQFRLRDPAVPSHTWTHAEVRLNGFADEAGRLRVTLKCDPLFLAPGDRVWLEIVADGPLSLIAGDPEHTSALVLSPDTEWVTALPAWAMKTLRPAILTYGRSFEYIPWEWDHELPGIDAPTSFGGMFDMAYPWQAVLRIDPGNALARIYERYGTGVTTRGRWPSDLTDLPDRTFDAPENAPDWAVYFRAFQEFRGKIATWWRRHQRADGQVGGGWNDDTLIFSRALFDMPLDGNDDALELFNAVFNGFDATNYFKGGYCRIHPIDRMHNGDFVRERYKSLVYNLGEPRSAVWAMEEARHWGRPDETLVNYGDGRAFLFGRDVLDWYWGRRQVNSPYLLRDADALTEILRTAALVADDTALWRFTGAWCHTDDQAQYGSNRLPDLLLGGWNSGGTTDSTYVNITVGVGWPDGGGPGLARRVTHSGNDRLTVDMYNFDPLERQATARLFRLRDGVYTVSLLIDQDNDGSYETSTSEERRIRRFDDIPVNVPSRTRARLDIEQVTADPQTGDLPDPALGDRYLSLEGNNLTVTVHNLGPVACGAFDVQVRCPSGEDLGRLRIEEIDGSGDYIPKTRSVTFRDLPPRGMYYITIDPDNKVREIYEGNNTATIHTGTI
jgi:hypothetical protein